MIITKQVQKNIPQGWIEGKLLDYFDIPTKITGVKQSEYEKNGRFPIFDQGQNNISGYFSNKDLLNKKIPAILFGDHTRVVKYINKPFVAGADGTKIFRAKSKFDSKFLYYLLLSQNIPNTGYNRHFKFLKSIKVLLPKLKDEQQKIAEILGVVDEDIAKTQEVIEATEKLKKGLMQKLFTQGIGNTKFKKTKFGEIPEKWEVKKIGDHVVHVGSGSTPRGGSKVYKTEGVPFIRSQNVYFEGFTRDGLVYIDESTHNDMSRSKVLTNDVLLNITGASIGRSCIVPDNLFDANVNQHVCIIRPTEELFFKYLFYFLQSQIGQNQIFKFQIGGNREGLNFQQIRSIDFPFSNSVVEQQKIAEILSAVDEKISVNKKLKEKLTRLKKGLMQDLLSGKVRV